MIFAIEGLFCGEVQLFDAKLRPIIDPPLNRVGEKLANVGVTADQVTWGGFLIGMLGCAAVAFESYLLGLILFLLSRLADGLDGAIARATQPTDAGGFLDITLDFIFYAAAVAAFAVADPEANALAAVILLTTYMASGASFLAFAIMAAKRGAETTAQGRKSLYYMQGLAEGFETILVTALFCVFPNNFALIALLFASIVAVSASARIIGATRALRR